MDRFTEDRKTITAFEIEIGWTTRTIAELSPPITVIDR